MKVLKTGGLEILRRRQISGELRTTWQSVSAKSFEQAVSKSLAITRFREVSLKFRNLTIRTDSL